MKSFSASFRSAAARQVLVVLILLTTARLPAADPFAENIRTTDPLTTAEQQKQFKLPPGFEIQLVASEPDINKPMNMAFDAKGRLWVTTSREYPFPVPLDKTGRDRVMIFEDFGPDGRARKVTQFADGLNIPIGVLPYGDGAIVWSIPNIWFLHDTDGDGKADKKEILYGPFDHTRDTHGNQASFRRGFDGWIYATHGFNNDSHVKGRDGHEVHLNSGNSYRFRPDGSRIEQHTWGQVNPFGLAWDERGNLYSSDCHSAPTYQLLAGGYYPSFGKPHDGLGFAPVLMEHSHGSTAIDGMLYYSDDLWPEEFRDNTFLGNVMTSRVNRDRMTFTGSTPKANELDDFVKTDDPWFRPVDNQLGPDGAFYIADFYNRIIGHYEVPLQHPGRDRERGRIWRVIYRGTDGQAKLHPAALANDLNGLLAELMSPNLTRRLLAMNAIQDRFGASAVTSLKQAAQGFWHFRAGDNRSLLMSHSLWLLQRLGALDEPVLTKTAGDASPLVRLHTMRVLAQQPVLANSLRRLAVAALGDTDALTARCATEVLGAHPQFENVAPLLALRQRVNVADTHLLYVVRKAIRDQLADTVVFQKVVASSWNDAEAQNLADVAVAVNSELAGTFLIRQLGRLNFDRATLASMLQHIARYAPANELDQLSAFVQSKFGDDLDFQMALFASVTAGAEQRGVKLGDVLRNWGGDLCARALAAPATSWWNTPLEAAPTANPWAFQERNCADGKKSRLLSSFPNGEPLTGTLRSPDFTLPAQLSFYFAGHDGFPDKPAQKKNVAHLRAAGTGAVLAEAFAPRNDTAQKITWNLGEHAGQQAYFEITDADTGSAYAWIAFGRFDPPVLTLPSVAPSEAVKRLQSAAELATKLQLASLTPALKITALSGGDPEARGGAAKALLALAPTESLPELAALLAEATQPAAFRARLGELLAEQKSADAHTAVVTAMKSVPTRMQSRWATALASTPAGADALLTAAEAGVFPPRLLQPVAMKNRLQAAKPTNWQTRLEKLTRDLPPADAARDKLIAERRNQYVAAGANPAEGLRVFTQNCAVCHRLDGNGGLVGPQLDGVGNRGLERLCEDVLDPNRNVDRAFRSSIITLTDGDVTSGLFRREEGELLIFADATGKEISIAKKAVKERRESETSLMPDNFGEVIPVEDFNHLMAFLLSKAGKP